MPARMRYDFEPVSGATRATNGRETLTVIPRHTPDLLIWEGRLDATPRREVTLFAPPTASPTSTVPSPPGHHCVHSFVEQWVGLKRPTAPKRQYRSGLWPLVPMDLMRTGRGLRIYPRAPLQEAVMARTGSIDIHLLDLPRTLIPTVVQTRLMIMDETFGLADILGGVCSTEDRRHGQVGHVGLNNIVGAWGAASRELLQAAMTLPVLMRKPIADIVFLATDRCAGNSLGEIMQTDWEDRGHLKLALEHHFSARESFVTVRALSVNAGLSDPLPRIVGDLTDRIFTLDQKLEQHLDDDAVLKELRDCRVDAALDPQSDLARHLELWSPIDENNFAPLSSDRSMAHSLTPVPA